MSNGAAHESITVSIVSHGHGRMIAELLGDLGPCPEVARIILTHNVPEAPIALTAELEKRTVIVSNASPAGFAANHNAAFRRSDTAAFCVMNPDIRLPANPFPDLMSHLTQPTVGLVAPAVVNPRGTLESTGRQFPTPAGLLLKALGANDGGIMFKLGAPPVRPDWVAGMFLLVDRDAFAGVGGFDEGFRLYYEDVDLCARLRNAGYDVLLCPSTHVVHDARRSSHRNVRYMTWHLRSMLRYFALHLGRLPRRPVS